MGSIEFVYGIRISKDAVVFAEAAFQNFVSKFQPDVATFHRLFNRFLKGF